MSKQTINIGASPNDGTGTPLRTSFDYTNQNFTELYTAVGPSGNNIVVPGNATITGDLTVDTSTLKVDSTNNRVGIGTASPGAALEVSGSATNIFIRSTDTNDSALRYYVNGTEVAVCRGKNGGSYAIETAGTERLRIDSTGNVGIGVTPSAWGIYKGLQVGYASLAGYAGSDTLLGSNVYFDGGAFKYIAAGLASSYRQLAGGHQWSTAVAGANPGDPLTLLPQMTLDASGNLSLANGNLVMGTSGKGIDFSATAGTGTSELLNDYEEGTFTPTISTGATAVTYDTQFGRYTKVGRLVTVYIQLTTLAATRNGSQFLIGGLPFASAIAGTGVIGYSNSGFVSTAGGNKPNMYVSGSAVEFYNSAGGSFAGTTIATDAFDVRFSATYFV